MSGEFITTILADGTVVCDTSGPAVIANASLTSSMLQLDSVTSAHIVDDTILEVDMSAAYKRGVANGIPTLDATGLIPTSQLPPQSITSVTMCANITCRNALSGTAVAGDVVIVMDRGDGSPETYIWDGSTWKEFMSTGVIIASTDDVLEGVTNLYFTQSRVSANTDVTQALAHAQVVTGNPHQLSLNDLLDVDLVSGGPLVAGQILAYDGTGSFIRATDMGEINTASSVGSGVSLFKQKVLSNLEFYTIAAGSSATILLTGPTANTYNLDVDVGAVAALLNANTVVDHTSVILSGANGISVSGTGDISASRTLTFTGSLASLSDVDSALAPSNGDILVYSSVGGEFVSTARQLASNVGAGAGNVFKQLLVNNYQFRTLVDAGSGRLSISTATDTVILDIQEGSVNHDALQNFVATEHVDHSSVALSGSGGITVSGSGDLTASRTIGRDINVIQSRVTGSCGAGQVISGIAADGTVTCRTLGVTTTPRQYICASGYISGAGTNLAVFGSTVSRTNVGRYSVTLTPSLATANYPVVATLEESSGSRDAILIQLVSGSRLVSGFNLMIQEGDNGNNSGDYVDRAFSYSISCTGTFVTGVTLV